jgi:hypothetical protein
MTSFDFNSYHVYFNSVYEKQDIFIAYHNFLKKSKNDKNFFFLYKLYFKKEFDYKDELFQEILNLDINEKDKKEAEENLKTLINNCKFKEIELDKDEVNKILENVKNIIRRELINDSFPLFIREKSSINLFKN